MGTKKMSEIKEKFRAIGENAEKELQKLGENLDKIRKKRKGEEKKLRKKGGHRLWLFGRILGRKKDRDWKKRQQENVMTLIRQEERMAVEVERALMHLEVLRKTKETLGKKISGIPETAEEAKKRKILEKKKKRKSRRKTKAKAKEKKAPKKRGKKRKKEKISEILKKYQKKGEKKEKKPKKKTTKKKKNGAQTIIKAEGGIRIIRPGIQFPGKSYAPPAQAAAEKPVATEQAPEKKTAEEELEEMEEKIKHLRKSYFRRQVTEKEFREKMYDYSEKKRLLELKAKKEKTAKKAPKTGEKKQWRSAGKKETEDALKEPEIETSKPQTGAESKDAPQPAPKKTEEPEKKRKKTVEEILKGYREPMAGKKVEKESPDKKREAIQKIMEKYRPAGEIAPSPTENVGLAEEKEMQGVGTGKIKELENKVETLMNRYNLSRGEMQANIKQVGASKLVSDFDKLISLIESKQGTEKKAADAKAFEVPTGIPKKKKPEVKEIFKEIETPKIVTGFDKLLTLIKERETVSFRQAQKELKMDNKRLKECCDILEDSGLIKIKYPAVGDIKIVDTKIDLIEAIQKVKKKQEKKKKRF